jgi:hypothetical protein
MAINGAMPLSQMTREEKIAKLQELQAPIAAQSASQMTREQKIAKLQELKASNAKSSRAGQIEQKSAPLPSNTPVRDNYTVDEPSFIESLASAAGSFSRGFEAIPSKIGYDINTTINSIAHGLDLMDTEEYESRTAELKQKLGQSIDYNDPDIKRFPGLAQNTQDIGALAAETLATGGIGAPATTATTGGARVLNAALQGGTQGTFLGLLQGDPGQKANAAAIGGTIGAILPASIESAVQGISKAVAPNLTRNQLEAQIAKELGLAKETNIQPTGQQLFGAINPRYLQAKESIQKSVSSHISDINKVEPGSSLKTRGAVIKVFKDAEKQASTQSNSLYKSATDLMDMESGPIVPQAGKQVSIAIKQDIATNPGTYGNLGKNSELIDFMNRVDNSENMLPSGIFSLRKDLDKAIRNISNQKDITNAESAMQKSLVKLRNGLDSDLQTASQASPETYRAMQSATQYWKDNVLALRNAGIQTVKGVSEYKPLMDFLKDPTKSDLAQQAINVLGEPGKQALKTNLATEALERSLDKTGNIDVANFVKNYKGTLNNFDLVFNEADGQMLAGIQKLVQSGGNIGKNNKMPIGGLVTGTLQDVKNILNIVKDNPQGQQILLTLGRLPRNSAKADNAIAQLYSLSKNIQNAAIAEQAGSSNAKRGQ